MNTAEATPNNVEPIGWWANKNFDGLDEDGNPRAFKRGDFIPGARSWPTFGSLKNIDWIVPLNPLVIKKEAVKLVEKNTEKKSVEETSVEFACTTCGKVFPTSRGMKVHMRFH